MYSSFHDDIGELLANLREQRGKLVDSMQEMRAVTASATTKDRMMRATVDSRGRLTELVLRGNRWRELAPTEFAARLVEVVSQAQENAVDGVVELAAEVTPEGMDFRALMAGELNVDELLPDFEDPEGLRR